MELFRSRMENLPPGRISLTEASRQPDLVKEVASVIRLKVAAETIGNRGLKGASKYGVFFASFWAYGMVYNERSQALKSGYFWTRDADDVADGDKPIPTGYDSKAEYLLKRREVAVNLTRGKNPTYGDYKDLLLVDMLSTASKLDITLGEEAVAIVDTMIFDVERSQARRIPTRAELHEYFNKLDFACIEGGLKIAGDKYIPDDVYDISMAVRTMFNLRDMPEDLAAGIVNIPAEDIAIYGVDLERAFAAGSIKNLVSQKALKYWYMDQMDLCKNHLVVAEPKLKALKLKPLTRFALSFNSTRIVKNKLGDFKKILSA